MLLLCNGQLKATLERLCFAAGAIAEVCSSAEGEHKLDFLLLLCKVKVHWNRQLSVCVLLQAPLQKYAAVLREKAAQRRAMRSSDEVQLNRKTSLLDGASDSEDEDEQPLQQSQHADDMQQAAEVSCASL